MDDYIYFFLNDFDASFNLRVWFVWLSVDDVDWAGNYLKETPVCLYLNTILNGIFHSIVLGQTRFRRTKFLGPTRICMTITFEWLWINITYSLKCSPKMK